MATTATDLEVFTEAPPAPPARPRVLLIGTALGAGGAAMVLLTLIALYARLRSDVISSGEVWLPEGTNLQLTPGGMGMVTLLMSLVTVSWAVWALRRDDRPHAYLAVGVTLLLGIAFVNATAYLYQQLALPLTFSGLGGLFYIVTGAHLVMVVVGYLLAIGGLIPGSRFWFDALGRLNSLRSSGKPPVSARNLN